MLTISEVAKRYNISNRQVHELINHGYLNVSEIIRYPNKGIKYLFSETEVENLDIYSHLADINDNNKNNLINKKQPIDFKKVSSTVKYYDRFIEQLSYYPHKEKILLENCFNIFHLNHYAKTYNDISNNLYALKNKVLEKMYYEYIAYIEAIYLIGQDRKKIWLCEDCKERARSAGIPYTNYIKQDYNCSKCFVQSVEKEYYSLVEFLIKLDDYKYIFHLPKTTAEKWIDIDKLPQGIRKTGKYDDKMYLYGRSISKTEEKVFPLKMIIESLNKYLNN